MPLFSSSKHTLPARELITLRTKGILLFCIVLGLIPAGLFGQTSGGAGEADPTLTTSPSSLQRWKNWRSGMCIQWGSVIAQYVKVRNPTSGVSGLVQGSRRQGLSVGG